jgi:hypothetical protein
MFEYLACRDRVLICSLASPVAACIGGGLAGRAEQDNVSDVRITAEEQLKALLFLWKRATSLRGNEAPTAAFTASARMKTNGTLHVGRIV